MSLDNDDISKELGKRPYLSVTYTKSDERLPSVFDYLWFPANRELVYGLAEGEPKKRGDILKRQGNVVWPKFGGE